MMSIKLDSLVAGKAGTTDRRVIGRVFRTMRSGVAIIGKDDGKQWIVAEPELVEEPRPMRARTDIPDRLAR